jgi:hypothetical protein
LRAQRRPARNNRERFERDGLIATSPITPRRVDERPVHNAKGEMWKKNVIAMLAMMMILTGYVFGHNGRPKNQGN